MWSTFIHQPLKVCWWQDWPFQDHTYEWRLHFCCNFCCLVGVIDSLSPVVGILGTFRNHCWLNDWIDSHLACQAKFGTPGFFINDSPQLATSCEVWSVRLGCGRKCPAQGAVEVAGINCFPWVSSPVGSQLDKWLVPNGANSQGAGELDQQYLVVHIFS